MFFATTDNLLDNDHQSLSVGPETDKGFAFKAFVTRHRLLADCELDLRQGLKPVPATKDDCTDRCVALSHQIEDCINRSQAAYSNDPEQMSTLILLLMETWMEMDQCALRVFPLLQDFAPGFPLHLLSVLRLPSQPDMYRLQVGLLIFCPPN